MLISNIIYFNKKVILWMFKYVWRRRYVDDFYFIFIVGVLKFKGKKFIKFLYYVILYVDNF